jgi:beta-lactamase superfamily II metal-dependent hydrolase
MKIKLFQSHQGDCLLIESTAGTRILCDGGTGEAMTQWIAAELAKDLRDIDLAYVSHIDRDHIGGIATMLDMAVQWRVYDYHLANGLETPEPALPKPPAVLGIWHNAFRDLITDNTGAIEDMLAATAPALQASQDAELIQQGYEHAQIATSVGDALTVSRLIKDDLLDVPLNVLTASPQHSGKLLMARDGQASETIGTFDIRIVCPSEPELKALREGWNNWLRKPFNRRAAKEIKEHYAGMLEASDGRDWVNPLDLYEWEGMPAYKGVTTPNVASLVLLVSEGNRRILLTGDNHPDKILDGLRLAGILQDATGLHLDVLKFPHHGSEHNSSVDFGRLVSADHYLFCGDGSNTNPELDVLETTFQSRLGPQEVRAVAAKAANRKFKFWFSTSPNVQPFGGKRNHMRAVEKWAREKSQAHPGLFEYQMNDAPATDIPL